MLDLGFKNCVGLRRWIKGLECRFCVGGPEFDPWFHMVPSAPIEIGESHHSPAVQIVQ